MKPQKVHVGQQFRHRRSGRVVEVIAVEDKSFGAYVTLRPITGARARTSAIRDSNLVAEYELVEKRGAA